MTGGDGRCVGSPAGRCRRLEGALAGVSECARNLWVMSLEGELKARPGGPQSKEFTLKLDK